LDAELVRLDTAFWSAASGLGAEMVHWPASFFFKMVGSPSFFAISICRISESLSERIFGLESAAGFAALAFSARLDHQTTPPSPAITTAAMSKRVKFMTALCGAAHRFVWAAL